MAEVRLADIYDPLTFAGLIQEAQIEKNGFISSGIVLGDQEIQNVVNVGGKIGELTNYTPLTTGEPNYTNDVVGDVATPANISNQKQLWRRAMKHKSWSTMDLAREITIAGQDPVNAITNRIGDYWATDDQTRVIQSSLGFLADNIANDSGDMLIDIATDDVAAITDAERISADAVLDAEQTIGDQKQKFTTIAMSSVLFTRLRKQQLIDFIPPARGEVDVPFYLGLRVIEDDAMPFVIGTNRTTYTVILYGQGVFVGAEGAPMVPSELERNASVGNGGGQDILHSRVSNVRHILGGSFLSASVAGESATYAELATATNWNRIYNRKNVPMAFLRVND